MLYKKKVDPQYILFFSLWDHRIVATLVAINNSGCNTNNFGFNRDIHFDGKLQNRMNHLLGLSF